RAVRLFGNGFHGTRFFAGYGRVDNRVVRTYLLAESAAHAVLLRNRRLAALERDGALGAVHHARPGFAAAAHVGDEILRLHTGVAGFVYHGQDVFLHILVVQRLLRIVGERYQVNILLVADVESEDGYDFVADD